MWMVISIPLWIGAAVSFAVAFVGCFAIFIPPADSRSLILGLGGMPLSATLLYAAARTAGLI